MKKTRFEWIDNIRGVMIILVALGHIVTDGSIDNTFNSIMRMPTFFMISGFLFKFKPPRAYLKHKLKHLILPYFVYLAPILAIQMILEDKSILEFFARLVLGGPYLYAWTGVFWFITCLFFTQQIFNLFRSLKLNKIGVVMLISLVLAYANEYVTSFNFPLSLNVCLYSCPLFFMGFLFKKHLEESKKNVVIPILLLIVIFVISLNFNELYINMKTANYGVAVISFLFSVLAAYCCIKLFQPFPNLHLFSFFGRASMVIMYLHLPINYMILQLYPHANQWLILVMAILIPTSLFYVFKMNKISRKYLLGESN